MTIKTINTKVKLKEVFNFISSLFYEESLEYNEPYFIMIDRYNEMLEQFTKDKNLLLYIEEDGKVVASLTSKNMDSKKQKITLGGMAVAKEKRRKGYGKALIKEFEKRCQERNISHIDLGARFRACHFYISMGYKYSLMVQVYDFVTIEDIRQANIFKLKEKSAWQGDTCGFIFFEVKEISAKYLKHFETSVKTAHAQYIFKKDLD